MKIILVALLAVTCAFTPALANDAGAPQSSLSAEDAFNAMLRLEGTWSGEVTVIQEGKPADQATKSRTTVTYRNIANDTSIVATYAEGTDQEMVSLFHQDGPEQLIHTHYCAVGNQPSMRFQKSAEPGVITFLFDHGTNMDVNVDSHVHNSTIQIIDKDTIRTETDVWSGGKKYATRIATLKRQKDAAPESKTD